MNNPNAYKDLSAALEWAWLHNNLSQTQWGAVLDQIDKYAWMNKYTQEQLKRQAKEVNHSVKCERRRKD